MLTLWSVILALLCGGVVGFSLGLMGGGGSILATPLLLYVVGVRDVHTAIGTGAVAVSLNAYANLYGHWRKGHVWWRCALVFTGGGVAGALLGSTLGKTLDGDRLLFLFGLLMIVVAIVTSRPLKVRAASRADVTASTHLLSTVVAIVVGFVSGLFGIGGGFLIVPGLMLATGMPLVNAVGTSLVAVGTFGIATAVNYAASGLVDWSVAGLFIVGGTVGGLLGLVSAVHFSRKQSALNKLFSLVILLVAAYILSKSAPVS